ncbi:hypothetical protein L1785_14505 [Antribacter sp. KLBMP9083]|uniref:Uncharacterized protein n=1 Tax=Antribacter soli TaxID=2910976 RepID=A0AA41UCL8_9MICO|nr:hypothetical protein [Antribacter soli]MCF4122189.1 hypothetical protein [Antribacter soli]
MGSPIFDEAARQWVAMRAEFDLVVQAAYEAAEEVTNACLLNRRGRAAGIDSFSLMTGPYARVEAYGSRELVEHFETVGRPSLERFEREWLAARTEWPADAAVDVPAAWLAEWESTAPVHDENAGRAA